MESSSAESVRFAFGSCNNQFLKNKLWDRIAERDPVAFIWAGDAIYADINKGFPSKRRIPATPERLNRLYKKQKEDAGYSRFLRNTNVTVTGTIDDHDMGINNGDETFEFKTESGVEFLDFIDMDKQSVMYSRAKRGMGVYGVTVFDFDRIKGEYLLSDEEAGIDPDIAGYNVDRIPKEFKKKRVAIFVLDVRTNKNPWGEGLKGWKRNYDGDFLGEHQWKWFETALQRSDASVNIIVNGIQVHPFRHPNAQLAENWAQFPTSRQRFYDAILSNDVRAPVLVSGDVHMAQLMRKDCWPRGETGASTSPKRSLIEFTTSGMTHSWGSLFASTPKFHHAWYRYYPLHFISKTTMMLAHFIMPMQDLIVGKTSDGNIKNQRSYLFENGGAEGAKRGKQFSTEKNFGEIEIDWQRETITIRALGENEDASSPLLAASFTIDQLSGIEQVPSVVDNYDEKRSRFPDFITVDGDMFPASRYICANHRGATNTLHFGFGIFTVSCYLCLCLLGPQILILRFLSKRLMNSSRFNRGI